ncbi:hypothetical protein Goarm_010373, partial [Gossypium armourianum]|nr:hypothetical protein [Gossypium armourianum]
MGEQLGKIAHALEQFIEDKTPHLYGEMISMEVEEFDDDFLCSVFDYLASRESNVNAFLAKILIMWCSTSNALGQYYYVVNYQ